MDPRPHQVRLRSQVEGKREWSASWTDKSVQLAWAVFGGSGTLIDYGLGADRKRIAAARATAQRTYGTSTYIASHDAGLQETGL